MAIQIRKQQTFGPCIDGFSPLYESSTIMASASEGTPGYYRDLYGCAAILEEADSPVTRKYQEKLFRAIITKGHVAFDSISKSQGIIRDYEGYPQMTEILDAMRDLAMAQKNKQVLSYVEIIKTAIEHIASMSSIFQRGFQIENPFVMSEYNTYVFTCVEATSALIYNYADYIKRPTDQTMKVVLKNTTMRANLFYFEQLQKFNKVQQTMHMDYVKLLEAALQNGRNNFIGIDAAIGYGAISLVALAIIPVSRELVYQCYNWRKNIQKSLQLQAQFLEFNRTAVENNASFTPEKKKKVLDRQASLARSLRSLANVISLESNKAVAETKKEIKAENKASLSKDVVKDDMESSPITLF